LVRKASDKPFSIYRLYDELRDRVAAERAKGWDKPQTPQLRDLQGGAGAFFFAVTPRTLITAKTSTAAIDKGVTEGSDTTRQSSVGRSELLIKNNSEVKLAPSAHVSAVAAPVGSSNSQSNKVTEGVGQIGFGPEAAQLVAAKASDLAVRLPPFGFGEIKGDVPFANRRFVGAWASKIGFEGKGRQAMLLVTDVTSDGIALGYVIIGPPTKFSSSQSPAWYDDFAGRISGGTLPV
jgi:hypothetical protein